MEKHKAEEICLIIKACRVSKVTKFKLGEMEIDFSDYVTKKKQEITTTKDWNAIDLENQMQLNLDGVEVKETSPEQEKVDDDYMSQLAVEDPAEWEKQMTGGLDA